MARSGWDAERLSGLARAGVSRGHCHSHLREIPGCCMKSNTSAAALGFGGILQKIAVKEKSEFNFYPSAFLSKCVLQSLTSRALPL